VHQLTEQEYIKQKVECTDKNLDELLNYSKILYLNQNFKGRFSER
jgi:hypothetical protein